MNYLENSRTKINVKTAMRFGLPMMVIAFFGVVITVLILSKPEPKSRPAREVKTKVFVATTEEESRVLSVFSQGEVLPVSRVQLRTEVEGKIVWMSKQLVAGGEFKRGDLLMKIDPTQYELIVIQRRARVAQSEESYAEALAENEAAEHELAELGRTNASDLAKGIPQLRQAEAALASAKAELKLAELSLSYTELRAPFDGRVQSKEVNVGQYLSRNFNAATIFATDAAEVRLSLSVTELAQIGLPLAYFTEYKNSPYHVQLSMDVGAKRIKWPAKIVRTEAVVDTRTRTIYAITRIENPYHQADVPLMLGAFVQAEITGVNTVEVSELPVKSLRNGRDLWLVDDENKLKIIPADIIQRSRERLLVAGLPSGSHIVTSALPIPRNGMSVEVVDPNLSSKSSNEMAADKKENRKANKKPLEAKNKSAKYDKKAS